MGEIDRRSFLKGTVAGGVITGIAALGGFSPTPEGPDSRKEKTNKPTKETAADTILLSIVAKREALPVSANFTLTGETSRLTPDVQNNIDENQELLQLAASTTNIATLIAERIYLQKNIPPEQRAQFNELLTEFDRKAKQIFETPENLK
jgi:gas vesicle protein